MHVALQIAGFRCRVSGPMSAQLLSVVFFLVSYHEWQEKGSGGRRADYEDALEPPAVAPASSWIACRQTSYCTC
jgi:hypothetical protein